MAYKEISGNIFNTKAMAVVNTVNCVGVMGKGIALDFKLRYPEMFNPNRSLDRNKRVVRGSVFLFHSSPPLFRHLAAVRVST